MTALYLLQKLSRLALSASCSALQRVNRSMACRLAGQALSARDDGVAVERVVFEEPGPLATGFGCDQSSAGATKRIEYDFATFAAVPDGVDNEDGRF